MTTENMKLSRRGFLGLGAAATAAAAAAGLAGCAPKTMAETGPAEPEGYTWETAPEPITEVGCHRRNRRRRHRRWHSRLLGGVLGG